MTNASFGKGTTTFDKSVPRSWAQTTLYKLKYCYTNMVLNKVKLFNLKAILYQNALYISLKKV